MEKTPYNKFDDQFLFRIYPQKAESSKKVFILFHGWTGNEDSMSVFLNSIPEAAIAILPRGIYHIQADQYGWLDVTDAKHHNFESYRNIAIRLHHSLNKVIRDLTEQNIANLNLIGFSQGAALSLVYSLQYRDEVDKTAILSGFLPKGFPENGHTLDIQDKFYVAHGTKDTLVDFQRAEEIQKYLIARGASVQFCQAEIGHKVSPACLSSLKTFFEET